MPDYEFNVYAKEVTWDMMHLVFNLVFLYILLLSGLARSLSDLAQLSKPDGSIPRGNWIFIVCGIMTIASGYLCGPPILISPETAAGIKSGARTGLSTMICGLLYALSIFFSPLLAGVPASGTSPLMFFVGLLLFQNIGRINFHDQLNGIPAFFVLLLIPFTYSIMCGVGSGYFLYVSMSLLTGKMYFDVKNFVLGYWNSWGGTHCPCSVDSSPRMYEEEVILRYVVMKNIAELLIYPQSVWYPVFDWFHIECTVADSTLKRAYIFH
jgi:xanthine/uracil/vitamin C permease (AzgA family)